MAFWDRKPKSDEKQDGTKKSDEGSGGGANAERQGMPKAKAIAPLDPLATLTSLQLPVMTDGLGG
jgi:hypothetical protein